MKDKKKLLWIGGLFTALLLILSIVVIKPGAGDEKANSVDKEKISVKDERGEMTVWRNGDVEFMDENGRITYDKWNSDKTNAFFNYFWDSYLDTEESDEIGVDTVTITTSDGTTTYDSGDDELVDVVIDELDDDGDDPGGGDEDDDEIDDYFGGDGATPTPRPSATPRAPTPTPKSPFENCLYWKLSYCVIAKPSPTPVPTAAPGAGVIEAADCEDWNESQTGRTVINNTVCIPGE